MNIRLLLTGLVIWAAATLALRAVGQWLLRPHNVAGTILLFVISLPLMAWVVRRLCKGAHLPHDQWLSGAVSIVLPTLLLDTFSSALFPFVFPNIAPGMAGVFGGWILWCCAGAFLGALVPGTRRA